MTGPIKVDVVIIGGGIMGLWLLKEITELKKNYQAVLLESREVGGQQTCHSHVYIHHGHLYTDDTHNQLPGLLNSARQKWSTWIGSHPEIALSLNNREFVDDFRSYFGFNNPVEFEKRQPLWKDYLKIECTEVALPRHLSPTNIRRVVSAEVHCLDGEKLVNALMGEVGDCVVQVKGFDFDYLGQGGMTIVSKPGIAADASGLVITAETSNSDPLELRPDKVILAAGAGNRRLMMDLARSRPSFKPEFTPQIRKAHMLVIEGSTADLPLLVGIFDRNLGSLFIVGRRSPEKGKNVWLVSDNRSVPMDSGEDWIPYDARWWLPSVLDSLLDIAPGVFADPGKLDWQIYEAPKAEAIATSATGIGAPNATASVPDEVVIQPCGEGVWAVWPSKLTLAPVASSRLIQQMGLRDGEGRYPPMQPFSPELRPGVAPETWTKVRPMLKWDDFSKLYHLSTPEAAAK